MFHHKVLYQRRMSQVDCVIMVHSVRLLVHFSVQFYEHLTYVVTVKEQ